MYETGWNLNDFLAMTQTVALKLTQVAIDVVENLQLDTRAKFTIMCVNAAPRGHSVKETPTGSLGITGPVHIFQLDW